MSRLYIFCVCFTVFICRSFAQDCPVVPNPTHGRVIYYTRRNAITTLSYECNSGYSLHGPRTRWCQANGQWSALDYYHPTCQLSVKQCPVTHLTNGYVSYQNGRNVGDALTYRCNLGYWLHGTETRTCQANGEWSPIDQDPMCLIVSCGKSDLLANGSSQYTTGNSPHYQSSIRFSCDNGYRLTGANERVCQASGSWSGTTPSCELIQCATIEYNAQPKNGYVTYPAGRKVNDTLVYMCNANYVLEGATMRWCQSDGNWTPVTAKPKCIQILCNNLLAPGNGTVVYTMDSAYSEYGHLQGKTLHGHKAIFICDEGFILNGSAILTCIGNEGPEGRFDGQPPSCESIAATAALISTKTKTEANRCLYTVILLILLMISLLIIGILVVYVIMLKRQRKTDDTVQMYNNTYYDTSSRAVTFATAAGMTGNTDINRAMTSVTGNNATDDTEIVVNEYYDSFEASGGAIAQSSAQIPAFKIGPATGDVYAEVQKEENEQLYANM